MTDPVARSLAVARNKQLWDQLVPMHLESELYDVAGFKAGANALGELELAELGLVKGKRLCHLLCHFGLDTLSFARLGAEVTGYDISDKALEAARDLAKDCGLEGTFIQGDIAEAGEKLSGPFDIVYMSWGVLGWISDLDRLVANIASWLAPGGVYYIIDCHPLVNALNEEWQPDKPCIAFAYNYEQRGDETMAYTFEGYAGSTESFAERTAYDWAHGLGRLVTAVAKAGLRVDFLHEHDKLAWQQLDCMLDDGEGYWYMPPGAPRLPVSFSLRAVKA
ncbi:MAG: class I SAM-dependent methyltransferase [Pseudomonadota bacterium]